MPVKHCLSRDGVFVLVWAVSVDGKSKKSKCRRCNRHPGDAKDQLTPHEIRVCLQKEEP